MKIEDFKIGKDYTWEQIAEYISTNDIEENHEYGNEIIGDNAIHLQTTMPYIDLWFILDSVNGSAVYYYKLVYKK